MQIENSCTVFLMEERSVDRVKVYVKFEWATMTRHEYASWVIFQRRSNSLLICTWGQCVHCIFLFCVRFNKRLKPTETRSLSCLQFIPRTISNFILICLSCIVFSKQYYQTGYYFIQPLMAKCWFAFVPKVKNWKKKFGQNKHVPIIWFR